jgi:hypothetical protein
MFAGGQVEKYPADEPEPATDAVIYVVPGSSAVITPYSSIEAIDEVCEVYVKLPSAVEQLGYVLDPGSHNSVSTP